MKAQSKNPKWERRLSSKAPLVGTSIRRKACRKLAADKTAKAVPFLVSALADSDEEVRRIAENALASLADPDAIDALFLGYVFTQQQSLGRILASLGRPVPDVSELHESHLSEPGQEPSPAEQTWRIHNSRDGTTLAFVPEGDFLAGEEGIRIHLPAYYMALTCVTKAQYAQFLTERRPSPQKLPQWINLNQSEALRRENDTYTVDPKMAEMPVVWVTWEGASVYCKWAGLRLPTELEWEKAARGSDGRIYPWGDEWDAGRPQPTEGRSAEQISAVLAFPSARSPYGIYQMIGNIYEWCADWYDQGIYERYARGYLKPPSHGEHHVHNAPSGAAGRFCAGSDVPSLSDPPSVAYAASAASQPRHQEETMIRRNDAPEPAVKRLSLYLRQLEQLATEGIDKTSSMNLAGMLNVTDAQIRKDLAYFGQFGRPGVGYRVGALIERLRHILGTDETWKVILVGAGDLGRALLRHRGFLERGFELVAAFDVSSTKVGKRVGRVLIHPIDELAQVVWKNDVKLAVVTVPKEAIQSVIDMLCQAGVSGILSFAPLSLRPPQGVALGVVDLAAGLEQLSFQITRRGL